MHLNVMVIDKTIMYCIANLQGFDTYHMHRALCLHGLYLVLKMKNWPYMWPQTCKCKKGTDWLKRWVEAKHNIFKL